MHRLRVPCHARACDQLDKRQGFVPTNLSTASLPHGRPQCAVHFALVWHPPHGISQCPTLLCTPAHADRGTVSLVMPWCCCAVQLQWWRRGAENDPSMPYSRVPVCGQESVWSL